jgi:hypothetical protein
VLRAATLLVWPVSLSVDYGPQVIPARAGFSLAALLGAMIVLGVPALVGWGRHRAPAIAFAAGVAGLSYLPTANLLFPSGVVLAERNLYLAVMLPAAAAGVGIAWLGARWGDRARVVAFAVSATLVVLCAAKSLDRLPAWRDNRAHLLTLLEEHPESSRAHASAAAVLSGIGDSVGARREYRTADSLFSGDPFVTAAQAILLFSLGDTGAAAPLVTRLEGPMAPAAQLVALRVQFLASLSRADTVRARGVAADAAARAPWEESWYRQYLQ